MDGQTYGKQMDVRQIDRHKADGWKDRHIQHESIIPQSYHMVGYKNHIALLLCNRV